MACTIGERHTWKHFECSLNRKHFHFLQCEDCGIETARWTLSEWRAKIKSGVIKNVEQEE